MIEVKWNSVTIQENFYDCCGKRIKMKNYDENGELTYTTIYIYIGWNTIYEKTIYPDQTITETEYIYGASGHIAKITDTGTIETTTFYHTDILGSVRQKTDSDGNSLWASIAIYKPFGGIYSGGPADDSETHLYTGKTYDYGTGLYYYGARFYDPEVGRFTTKDRYTFLPNDERLKDIQGDVKKIKGTLDSWIVNPQNFNGYSYGKNNPLRFVDMDGHQPIYPPPYLPYGWDFWPRNHPYWEPHPFVRVTIGSGNFWHQTLTQEGFTPLLLNSPHLSYAVAIFGATAEALSWVFTLNASSIAELIFNILSDLISSATLEEIFEQAYGEGYSWQDILSNPLLMSIYINSAGQIVIVFHKDVITGEGGESPKSTSEDGDGGGDIVDPIPRRPERPDRPPPP